MYFSFCGFPQQKMSWWMAHFALCLQAHGCTCSSPNLKLSTTDANVLKKEKAIKQIGSYSFAVSMSSKNYIISFKSRIWENGFKKGKNKLTRHSLLRAGALFSRHWWFRHWCLSNENKRLSTFLARKEDPDNCKVTLSTIIGHAWRPSVLQKKGNHYKPNVFLNHKVLKHKSHYLYDKLTQKNMTNETVSML